jgi:hypothetical protein
MIVAMLLVVIPTAWIAVATLVVLVCRGAAAGDVVAESASEQAALQLLERARPMPAAVQHDPRIRGARPITIRDTRSRGSRCIVNS